MGLERGSFRELKTLAKEKTTAKKIVKSLKRTVGATRQKAFSMDCHLTYVCNQPKHSLSRLPASPAMSVVGLLAMGGAFSYF